MIKIDPVKKKTKAQTNTHMKYTSLPDEVRSHIEEVASNGPLSELLPCSPGASDHPFFQPNASLPCQHPSVEDRLLSSPWLFPQTLARVYAKYPTTTEFRDTLGEWQFMSEDEIVKRATSRREQGQHRVVDLAIRYAGMGHVQVLAYDPVSQRVFVDMDGGSNGFDRQANLRRRNAEDIGRRSDTIPFDEWWASHRCENQPLL